MQKLQIWTEPNTKFWYAPWYDNDMHNGNCLVFTDYTKAVVSYMYEFPMLAFIHSFFFLAEWDSENKLALFKFKAYNVYKKCDAIRQNESEVAQINFSFLYSCIRHCLCPI